MARRILIVVLFSPFNGNALAQDFGPMNFCSSSEKIEYAVAVYADAGQIEATIIFDQFVAEGFCWRKGGKGFSADDEQTFVAVRTIGGIAYGYFRRKDENGQDVFIAAKMAVPDPDALSL